MTELSEFILWTVVCALCVAGGWWAGSQMRRRERK